MYNFIQSNAFFTTPANGYIAIYASILSNSNAGYAVAYYDSTHTSAVIQYQRDLVNANGGHHGSILPMRKGQYFNFSHWNVSIGTFRFIYAEGEI